MESARRVAEAEVRAVGAETKLCNYIGKSAALLSGKGVLNSIEDKRSRRKEEQGGLWVYIQEGDDSDTDVRIHSPLPEVTPRDMPLHVAALEEVDEGVPPEHNDSAHSQVPVEVRDYSYSYDVDLGSTASTRVPGVMPSKSPGLVAAQDPFEPGDLVREDAL